MTQNNDLGSPAARRRGRFTLRELEILRTVIALRKTTLAAQKLGISQPAVSRAIAQVEARMGRELFAREGGRLSPTADALALNTEIDPIFSTLARLEEADWRPDHKDRLKIVAPPTLGHFLLPRLFKSFLAEYPDARIHAESGTTSTVIAAVADDRADLGLTDGNVSHQGLKITPYRQTMAHAILPVNHPLARKEIVTPEDFDGENFIAFNRRFQRRSAYDKLFAERGIARNIIIETATSHTVLEMVRQGAGVALINPFPLVLQNDPEVVFRKFVPEVAYTTSFILPSGPATSLAQRFVEHARKYGPEDDYSTPV
ncbi:MAG: LysR substrate-binding domain-containing protein [Stappiaceae bacterium]